jgi:hypothetical protein
VRVIFSGLSSWRPPRAAMRYYRDHPRAYVRRLPPAWLRDRAGERMRGYPRLPLCLTDSTFVVDNIRCQHSPPVCLNDSVRTL